MQNDKNEDQNEDSKIIISDNETNNDDVNKTNLFDDITEDDIKELSNIVNNNDLKWNSFIKPLYNTFILIQFHSMKL